MARRRIIEYPMSKLAIWSRRLAFFSLAATSLTIIIVRTGLLEVYPALVTFGGALAVAALSILLVFAAGVVIWRLGLGGIGHAVTAFFISAALLAYPAYLGAKAYRLPAITDITTDPLDPPRYEAVGRVRPREANSVIYAGLYTAEQQETAYPDIEPLEVSIEPRAAYDAAMAVVTKQRWNVIVARMPAGPREGHIEAVARTPIMGFREDVVIRVRADEDGARIDVRSSSRYGRHDFGTNAERIRALLDDIEDAADRPAKKTPAPKPRPVKVQTPAPAKR